MSVKKPQFFGQDIRTREFRKRTGIAKRQCEANSRGLLALSFVIEMTLKSCRTSGFTAIFSTTSKQTNQYNGIRFDTSGTDLPLCFHKL